MRSHQVKMSDLLLEMLIHLHALATEFGEICVFSIVYVFVTH